MMNSQRYLNAIEALSPLLLIFLSELLHTESEIIKFYEEERRKNKINFEMAYSRNPKI